jgi:hypothetical protein
MILKSFLLISFFISFNCNPINDDECSWSYKCCKKIESECVELCEPIIICPRQEMTTEQDIYNMPISSANMITAECRSGWRRRSDGKCRMVL